MDKRLKSFGFVSIIHKEGNDGGEGQRRKKIEIGRRDNEFQLFF